MKASLLLVAVCSCLLAAPAFGQQIQAGGWSIKGSDPIQVYFKNELVTAYNAGKAEGKPFFYPVIGPTGENLTRHWPMKEGFEDEAHDHIHHRGMWYGLGNVNGLDFWHFPGDEKKKDRNFGRIIHKSMNGILVNSSGVTIKTKSDWVSHSDNAQKVCSDRRAFTFSKGEDDAVIVDTEITLVAEYGDVTIHDDKEGAWSIRVIPTLRLEGDHAKGSILNSEGMSGKEAWGKRANWVDYHGVDRAGNSVGIAIFDHPKNLRHPTWWHARHYGLFTANPFGQGNFEKETEKGAGDYTIKKGEEVTFRYRTIFHKGTSQEAEIAAEYDRYIGEEK